MVRATKRNGHSFWLRHMVLLTVRSMCLSDQKSFFFSCRRKHQSKVIMSRTLNKSFVTEHTKSQIQRESGEKENKRRGKERLWKRESESLSALSSLPPVTAYIAVYSGHIRVRDN